MYYGMFFITTHMTLRGPRLIPAWVRNTSTRALSGEFFYICCNVLWAKMRGNKMFDYYINEHEKRTHFENVRAAFKYYWIQIIMLAVPLAALIAGVIKLLDNYDERVEIVPFTVSIALAGAQLAPPLLTLHHGLLGHGCLMRLMSWVSMILTYAALALALFLLWWFRPESEVDYTSALTLAVRFYNGLYAGEATPVLAAEWRGPEVVTDSDGLTGGMFAGGELGFAKATMPTAFSMTMLAWALLRH